MGSADFELFSVCYYKSTSLHYLQVMGKRHLWITSWRRRMWTYTRMKMRNWDSRILCLLSRSASWASKLLPSLYSSQIQERKATCSMSLTLRATSTFLMRSQLSKFDYFKTIVFSKNTQSLMTKNTKLTIKQQLQKKHACVEDEYLFHHLWFLFKVAPVKAFTSFEKLSFSWRHLI